MALQDKYINFFTDFGFKKLFEAAEIARYTGLPIEEIEKLK